MLEIKRRCPDCETVTKHKTRKVNERFGQNDVEETCTKCGRRMRRKVDY